MKLTSIFYLGAIAIAAAAVYVVLTKGVKTVGDVASKINPLNHDNVISQAANAAYSAVTGDTVNTLGTAAADLVDRLTTNSGAIATAPSVPSNVISLADYFASVDADDQAQGGWISNGGGAATGRIGMKR